MLATHSATLLLLLLCLLLQVHMVHIQPLPLLRPWPFCACPWYPGGMCCGCACSCSYPPHQSCTLVWLNELSVWLTNVPPLRHNSL